MGRCRACEWWESVVHEGKTYGRCSMPKVTEMCGTPSMPTPPDFGCVHFKLRRAKRS